MSELLTIVVIVAVRMIDPIGIVLALIFGALATVPKERRMQWVLVGVSAVGMMIAFALLASYHDSLLGTRRSGAWAPMRLLTTLTAAGLQITAVVWLIGWWRRRSIAEKSLEQP